MCIICEDLLCNITVMVVEGGIPWVFTLECKRRRLQSRGFYQELHYLTCCQESMLTKPSLLDVALGFPVWAVYLPDSVCRAAMFSSLNVSSWDGDWYDGTHRLSLMHLSVHPLLLPSSISFLWTHIHHCLRAWSCCCQPVTLWKDNSNSLSSQRRTTDTHINWAVTGQSQFTKWPQIFIERPRVATCWSTALIFNFRWSPRS